MVCLNTECDHFLVLKSDLRVLIDREIVRAGTGGKFNRDTIEAFESSFAMGLRAGELRNTGKRVAIVRPSGEVEVVNGS